MLTGEGAPPWGKAGRNERAKKEAKSREKAKAGAQLLWKKAGKS